MGGCASANMEGRLRMYGQQDTKRKAGLQKCVRGNMKRCGGRVEQPWMLAVKMILGLNEKLGPELTPGSLRRTAKRKESPWERLLEIDGCTS